MKLVTMLPSNTHRFLFRLICWPLLSYHYNFFIFGMSFVLTAVWDCIFNNWMLSDFKTSICHEGFFVVLSIWGSYLIWDGTYVLVPIIFFCIFTTLNQICWTYWVHDTASCDQYSILLYAYLNIGCWHVVLARRVFYWICCLGAREQFLINVFLAWLHIVTKIYVPWVICEHALLQMLLIRRTTHGTSLAEDFCPF
jgi:hypothetical protein